jgi:RND superfamily putative drug exporter
MPAASLVSPPRLSASGDTALIGVQYRVPVTAFHGSAAVDALTAAAAPARARGLAVELGGMVPGNVSKPSGTPEAIGILAALIVLALALASLAAAGLPLVVAIAGLGAGTAVIGLLCSITSISTTAPTVATMVGLGVGIDYALLLVSRHAEGLREGLTPQQAAARATSIAGTSVIIAGLTVLVSLFGLRLSTLPVYASFGYATFITVTAVTLATVTLVPALCALAGHRLLPRRQRRRTARPAFVRQPGPTRTEAWAAAVARRPVAAALGALIVLLALAAPVLAMRTWPQDAGSQPVSNTTRRAHDLVSAKIRPRRKRPTAGDRRSHQSALPGTAGGRVTIRPRRGRGDHPGPQPGR